MCCQVQEKFIENAKEVAHDAKNSVKDAVKPL
jgi:hypothetical protein